MTISPLESKSRAREGGQEWKKGEGESDFPSNCYPLLLKQPSHLIYCTEGVRPEGEGDNSNEG